MPKVAKRTALSTPAKPAALKKAKVIQSKPKAKPSSSNGKKSSLNDDLLFQSDSEEERSISASAAHDDDSSDAPQPNPNKSSGGTEENDENPNDPFAHETVDERRLRLAQDILRKLKADQAGADASGSDAEASDGEPKPFSDPIAHRLQQDVLKERGRLQVKVAHKIESVKEQLDSSKLRVLRGHRLSVTCVCVTADDRSVYSGSKDGSIIHWDAATGKKLHSWLGVRGKKGIDGHSDEVLALAVSSNGGFLASGGRDMNVLVWDTQTRRLLKTFPGHRGAVTCLCFRWNSLDLFSASNDRTVKIWNLENMAYVETLFGHQSEITGIDALYQNRAITAGNDKSLRVWKVVEETQLLFNKGHSESVDTVALVNDDKFIAGSQDGALSSWTVRKKKPVSLLSQAHSGHWITAVAALPFSDLAASGSSDGFLRLWRVDADSDALEPLHSVAVPGFLNALAFARSGRFLVLGVGQEHRMGRWRRDARGRNGIQILPLSSKPLSVPSTTLVASAASSQAVLGADEAFM